MLATDEGRGSRFTIRLPLDMEQLGPANFMAVVPLMFSLTGGATSSSTVASSTVACPPGACLGAHAVHGSDVGLVLSGPTDSTRSRAGPAVAVSRIVEGAATGTISLFLWRQARPLGRSGLTVARGSTLSNDARLRQTLEPIFSSPLLQTRRLGSELDGPGSSRPPPRRCISIV